MNYDFPLKMNVNFSSLFEKYQANLDSNLDSVRNRAREVLERAERNPKLSKGFLKEEEIIVNKEDIDFVLEDLFAPVLQQNEIKVASIPYQKMVIKSSERFQKIVDIAGGNKVFEFRDFNEDEAYIMGCSMILGMYYGYKVDFRRPFYFEVPDENNMIKYYKVLYNADFVSIEKTKNSIEITKDDVAVLIENFDNIALWKEKFPPNSWLFKGFVIANMYDATIDVSLANFKTNLLKDETKNENFVEEFRSILRSIFGLPSLNVGYTLFNEEENVFEKVPHLAYAESYLLNNKKSASCKGILCDESYDFLFNKHQFFCVSDVEKYHKKYPKNQLYKGLHEQNVQSAIITSLVLDGKVVGVLEIVSPNVSELNTVNANKLYDIMPYLLDSVRRTKEREENAIELMIQNECTSIHPSVHWKFKKEAKRVLQEQLLQNDETMYQEIVFENVYPLFGQIDIKGSSTARNWATKKDLELQLKHIKKIIEKVDQLESLPIYQQIIFRVSTFLDEFKDELQVDSERQILDFVNKEIVPLLGHVALKDASLDASIMDYNSLLEPATGLIYKYRKDYDDAVMQINKEMASILDAKQQDAQGMYPHYFERFKTDGVEHNMYIGESITKEESFNKVYLYNLRLWQLQVMCEMENSYYKLKKKLPVSLDVASMILAFNTSLALRFRMDEKRFDVDGTYNARYEVVKKRVDKANIKGTNERITQAGKIAIVYSQLEDQNEYTQYINFLQHKKLLDTDIEVLDLEDLQGVTGLKALRVSVLYSKGENKKEYYTYEDLINELDG